MSLNAFSILVVISILLAILSLIKPTWPLCLVAVLLLAIAVLIGKGSG